MLNMTIHQWSITIHRRLVFPAKNLPSSSWDYLVLFEIFPISRLWRLITRYTIGAYWVQ